MEGFTIKIDNKLKANLYKICRLCGIDNPDMIPVVSKSDTEKILQPDSDLELSEKIEQLLGLVVNIFYKIL